MKTTCQIYYQWDIYGYVNGYLFPGLVVMDEKDDDEDEKQEVQFAQ